MAEETPPAALDENRLNELIGKAVNDVFDKRKAELAAPSPDQPAPPSGDQPAPPQQQQQMPADMATMVNNAVEKALAKRDEEDQIAVLAASIEDLKKSVAPARKRAWGSFLVGGFGR